MSEAKEKQVWGTPKILHEDNHLLVALKEPNLLTQGDETGDPDMLSLLKAYIKDKYEKPGEAYLGLVHRMDRPVGGLLCFARTSKAAARLSMQVKAHTLRREYVLVAQGDAPDTVTLTDRLVKDSGTNLVRVVPGYLRQGKEAVLHLRTIVRREGLSLCCVRLETGRAHQIRVQLANARLPLWGDNRYGQGKPGQQIALWGMRLSLAHPITGQQMVFMAPPPDSGIWGSFRRELAGLEAIWPDLG
ncbi:MAG: RluA family pseudouridine synthase [Christensenellales bacterium]